MCRWKQTTVSWLKRNVPLKIMATHLVVVRKMGCWMRWLAYKWQWRDDDGESMKSQVSLVSSKWWEKWLDVAKDKNIMASQCQLHLYMYDTFWVFQPLFPRSVTLTLRGWTRCLSLTPPDSAVLSSRCNLFLFWCLQRFQLCWESEVFPIFSISSIFCPFLFIFFFFCLSL